MLLRHRPTSNGDKLAGHSGLVDRPAGDVPGQTRARLNSISALAAYQQGNADIGDKSLAQAITFQRNGSLRLFHIAPADTLYTNGTVTPRVAMDLYNEVLRDPTPTDWGTDPLEALSLMMVPHELAYEHWFEVAVDRKTTSGYSRSAILLVAIASSVPWNSAAGRITYVGFWRVQKDPRSGGEAPTTGPAGSLRRLRQAAPGSPAAAQLS